ncbi:Piwi domain-containing protein [Intestinibacter sp.]|uniref:Piwi domain-containing protein n=1 Tax=Intestinibacter sp. TaxID=1965304 RepID=UPI002A915E50|nr:Piwi domain-containing protein [Intestinibacter sp.]MDY5211113.1 Piwi domain-containing protein [Intestinibacter sp.]
MVCLDREFNVITEFKNELKPENIKIYMYIMPVKDINERHSENYAIVQELKKLNQNLNIVFNEYIIASFEPIIMWGKYKDIEKIPEHRSINLENEMEKKILERLILCDIKNSINNTNGIKGNKYEIRGNANSSVYLRKPIYQKNNLIIRRKLNFDVNIEKEDIIIGFFLSHEFEYENTLKDEIRIGNIKKGDKVKDFYNNITYEFIGIAPFSISQKNEYMKTSIIDYYINKNQSYVIAGLDKNTKAVLVKNKEGTIFPYIPNRLKRVCTFENLGNKHIIKCNSCIKMDASQNMRETMKLAQDILKKSRYVKFNKKKMLVEELGYKKYIIKRPALKFGKNESNFNVINLNTISGLNQGGSYEKKTIKLEYFLDPKILYDKREHKIVLKFLQEIVDKSKSLGIKINIDKSYINLNPINIENENVFELHVRDIVKTCKNPVLIILEKENLDKYYDTLKKIFGGRNSTPTQFVDLDTIKRSDGKGKEAIFLNILLGIYCKSGIQPWVLANNLSADCYIGLDVCRENNMSTAGLIQVVGKDGRVLKSKTVSSNQNGEKIEVKLLKEVVFEAIGAYKDTYNRELKHIVFHRDGINREDLEKLKEITDDLNIKFDYIEVTKNINRRMAMLEKSAENYNCEKENKKWITEIGMCLKKENEAYLITTNPHGKMGMARPLRIKKIYGNQPMESIIEDIYKLSFMHIGSIMKSRLPITTHYADLSSIYSHRDFMPKNIDTNILHFI